MITSASGWRKVFAISGDENDNTSQISENDSILSGIAAEVFADYIIEKNASPVVILGQDTRPTGRAICQAMLKVLVAKNIRVNYPGIIAAPEIMAYGKSASGFIYISASHNPIGHNGIKFGLDDGGVLNGTENAKLVKALNEKCASPSEIERIRAILNEHKSAKNANSPEEARDQANEVIARSQKSKVDAKSAYMAFSKEVISATGDKAGQEVLFSKIKQSISENPLGIIADMNGSARTLSIDKAVFKDAGISYYGINDEPGKIVHAIIPEPENLVWAASEMERLQKEGHSEVKLGYMPDCDGDRGNIVFWNEKTGKAEVLKAQEVFALSVLSELSYMKYLDEVSGSNYGKNLAVAANCPTSMRIDEVTKAFGASLFRAEVGEANVVNLARKKRDEGFTVRILGEGSNGGNITHPAAVRDPLNTIFALVKLLVLRDSEEGCKKIKGLFHIWCDSQNLSYNNDFTLLDVIETLPVYTTTGVAEEKYGIEAYEAIGTNGTEENRKLTDYSKNGKGGLKILFTGKDKLPLAYIWMRGSGTEPVFRVLCDVKGNNSAEEHELLDWERSMILKADNL